MKEDIKKLLETLAPAEIRQLLEWAREILAERLPS